MRILFDIGHPAHVHYFKNLNLEIISKGHKSMFVARDKEVTIDLLRKYKIDFICRGKGATTLLGKLFYLFKANIIIMKTALKFKPDIFISFASPYAAQVSWIMLKPHISFTDTEHAKLGNIAFIPFTTNILTPSCFNKGISKKQIKFDLYMELSYLHPNYFTPDKNIFDLLDIIPDEKYVILRFVSWEATHDIGHSGLDYNSKVTIVKELSKITKVFISSELELVGELKEYQLKIPPEKMHDALANATLFVGEGATMASECACLGTPAIYVNSLEVGYCTEQENKYNLIYCYRNSEGVLEKAKELLLTPDVKKLFRIYCLNMLKEKINVTKFMVWFVESYPKSETIMKNNPHYQFKFK